MVFGGNQKPGGMISLGTNHRYFLYTEVTDMRKSFDGLSGLVRNQMDKNPLDGDVYIFLNKRRGLIKLLLWDRSGYVIYAKRLERGTYELPKEKTKTNSGISLAWEELMLIIEGIPLEHIQRRRRYAVGEKIEKKGELSPKKRPECG